MSSIQDAKGKLIPSWARHTKVVAAAGSYVGVKDDDNNYVPFGILIAEESAITYTTVDDPATEVTFTFPAGIYPIEFVTITSTAVAVLMLFAYKPKNI